MCGREEVEGNGRAQDFGGERREKEGWKTCLKGTDCGAELEFAGVWWRVIGRGQVVVWGASWCEEDACGDGRRWGADRRMGGGEGAVRVYCSCDPQGRAGDAFKVVGLRCCSSELRDGIG